MSVEIGTLFVRRSCLIAATPEQVWREFTTLEQMRAWFGRGHALEVYEPRLGGRVGLSVAIDGAHRRFGGRIAVFEAGRVLSFEDNWETDPWTAATQITLRLTNLYGDTLVELFHHGFERLGPAAAHEHAGYEAAWDLKHLLALRDIVEAD